MNSENIIVDKVENKKEDYELAISVLLESNAMLTSENNTLKEKLDIALDALEKIKQAKGGVMAIDDLGHEIEFNNYEGDIAIDALEKMGKIK